MNTKRAKKALLHAQQMAQEDEAERRRLARWADELESKIAAMQEKRDNTLLEIARSYNDQTEAAKNLFDALLSSDRQMLANIKSAIAEIGDAAPTADGLPGDRGAEMYGHNSKGASTAATAE